MPTGYTAKLYEGEVQNLRDFILTCSRAFSATIRQRDEANDVPPRLIEADTDYHDKSIAAALKVLNDAPGWTDDEAADLAASEHVEARKAWEKSEAQRVAIRERYAAMLGEVEGWCPPTEEHEALKTFMLEQLLESIKFDGYMSTAPVAESGPEYRDRIIERAQRDVRYGQKERWKEIERVQNANRWIAALYESIPDA